MKYWVAVFENKNDDSKGKVYDPSITDKIFSVFPYEGEQPDLDHKLDHYSKPIVGPFDTEEEAKALANNYVDFAKIGGSTSTVEIKGPETDTELKGNL